MKSRSMGMGVALMAAILLLGTQGAPAQRAVDRPTQRTQPAAQPPRAPAAAPAAGQRAAASLGTAYAKRAGVEVKRTTERTSPNVATLKSGEAVTVLLKDGARLKVRTAGGAEGFVAALNIASTPPAQTGSRSGIIIADNMSPGERQNVSSVRGLSPMAKEYALAAQLPEKATRDVEKMEANGKSVSASALSTFLKEGQVVAP